MNINPKIVIISLLLNAFATSVKAQDMRTIDDFISQNINSTNNSTQIFLGLRCSSLFSLLGAYLFEVKMYEAAEKFKIVQNNATAFLFKYGSSENQDYLVNQSKIMLESYSERFLKSKAMTGNFSDDPVISADVKTCNELFNNVK